ncbi:hypothetical protein [Acidithiobacillus caldus]|uniref:Uncharacterized protein n=2 Tax=Acidithiobacillus caldus TaxID=33059 RepID=F9ZPU6_ACICS|nr:hypothetical protein [Acidithiobacillus caldus]AEK58483.1 conserved hypothetical protein [Acidithiobacillus caldus SM-1]AIA55524.1 hypothetical protein Acaty_c1664 [Acidithiobacillus caldus ATCC 51756]AUW33065.1 hypothetical protein A5904_09185 [Acidithiobacillus caldus]MBU2731183.1 hypothetical protein [Acidithiobacillus caldus]MBU2734413.1 hypothetical protein [Acidithiobacillus caldus ATCC 51756]
MQAHYQHQRRQKLLQENRMAWLSLEVTPATRQRLQALSKALGKPQRHIIENLIREASHGI